MKSTRKRKIKVMAFGTFDVLHPGHLYFLKHAKDLGDVLIVSVARDVNAARFKGQRPLFNEQERLEIVRNLKLVDRAVLGDRGYYLSHILKEKPDIIALGYDQKSYNRHLPADLADHNLKTKIVRLKPFKHKRYKSSKLKSIAP